MAEINDFRWTGLRRILRKQFFGGAIVSSRVEGNDYCLRVDGNRLGRYLLDRGEDDGQGNSVPAAPDRVPVVTLYVEER
jgi:hypothetical protein